MSEIRVTIHPDYRPKRPGRPGGIGGQAADSSWASDTAPARTAVPIRRALLQQGQQGGQGQIKAGPLATLVRHHDERALELYLVIRAAASAPPYDVRHYAAVWARALYLEGNGGAAAVSKTLARLEMYRLIARQRVGHKTRLVLLRADGSGEQYTRRCYT